MVVDLVETASAAFTVLERGWLKGALLAELYRLMNGMTIREMDQIIYPVCILCRNHERSGFIHGVQVGIRLAEELK